MIGLFFRFVSGLSGLAVSATAVCAQWVEDFEDDTPIVRVAGHSLGGWSWMSGDGEAWVIMAKGDGMATVLVDARRDELNTWWALIRKRIDDVIDLGLLSRPGYELRVEARVRSSHAPRRFNLHFNTHRTTDFHSHLMEYDIGTAHEWHTVSMTTENFDARPGDQLAVQLALMDWGRERYRLDIDYLRVDVVRGAQAGPDLGDPQHYQPAVPPESELTTTVVAQADTTLDAAMREAVLNRWGRARDEVLLGVSGSMTPLLRFDLSDFRGKQVEGLGVLTLTTGSLFRPFDEHEELGRVRVFEVLEGPAAWEEVSLSYHGFCGDAGIDKVLNGQMIIDVEIDPRPGAVNRIALPRSVVQRLVDGRTHSLALRPLGSVMATFAAREEGGEQAPRLSFRLH